MKPRSMFGSPPVTRACAGPAAAVAAGGDGGGAAGACAKHSAGTERIDARTPEKTAVRMPCCKCSRHAGAQAGATPGREQSPVSKARQPRVQDPPLAPSRGAPGTAAWRLLQLDLGRRQDLLAA